MGVWAAVGEKSQKRFKNYFGENGVAFLKKKKTPPGPNTLPRHRVEARLQAKITRGWNAECFWSPGGELIG